MDLRVFRLLFYCWLDASPSAYFRGLISKTAVDDHGALSMAKLRDALDDDVPRFDFDFDSPSPPPTQGIVLFFFFVVGRNGVSFM